MLENFTITLSSGNLITKNTDEKYVNLSNRINALGRICYSNYTHLNDNDLRAILMTITGDEFLQKNLFLITVLLSYEWVQKKGRDMRPWTSFFMH